MRSKNIKDFEILPRPFQNERHVDDLIERKHPTVWRKCEGQVATGAESQEDVLQSGAARLVRLGEGDVWVGVTSGQSGMTIIMCTLAIIYTLSNSKVLLMIRAVKNNLNKKAK